MWANEGGEGGLKKKKISEKCFDFEQTNATGVAQQLIATQWAPSLSLSFFRPFQKYSNFSVCVCVSVCELCLGSFEIRTCIY